MRFTEDSHNNARLRLSAIVALVAAVVLSAAALVAAGVVGAYDGPAHLGPGTPAQAQQGSDPEANLPFLFAVYIVTWAAFFAYVFYVSRRQREMQREIDALNRALEERDGQNQEQDKTTKV